MNETIIMRLAWYKTLINSVTYVADTPIGSYEIDVITDNGCGYDQWRITSTKLSKYDTE